MEATPSPREYLWKAIDDQIKSLEVSIQELRPLRHRRNELAPISSLPTEVIGAIFSLLRVPTLDGKPDHRAWLRVAHVCHHWREIALNQPLLWSHLDFTAVSSAGAVEILARAKKVPLHLKANVPFGHWDDARFRNLQKELKTHASRIRHLELCIEPTQLKKTLNHLISPAPTLEYLFLSCQANKHGSIESIYIPNTLFDGATPRLSCLKLEHCNINWMSPLLRGVEHLHILSYSAPNLSDWLDALDEMPQLKTLNLHSSLPTSTIDPAPFDVERTVTLPSLTLLNISGLVRVCGLALAHLVLPALITLGVHAESYFEDGRDVPDILPHVTRQTYGCHHTQPLQSVFVRSAMKWGVEVLAWTVPDINFHAMLSDTVLEFPLRIATPMHSLQVVIFGDWLPVTCTEVFDMLRLALPLDGIVTLAVEKPTRLDKQFWLGHAPQWPLLRCMQLGSRAASGLVEMLLEDNEGREGPLFPLLTKLVLFDSRLSAPRTLRLCDALMNRVEQGVPLETLELRTCIASHRAVKLLGEIVTEVLGPEGSYKERALGARSKWDATARGFFVAHDSSGEDEDDIDS